MTRVVAVYARENLELIHLGDHARHRARRVGLTVLLRHPGDGPRQLCAELVRTALPDERDGHQGLGGLGGVYRHGSSVIPELEGARLAHPLDRAPLASRRANLDIAVESDEAIPVRSHERVGTSNAPAHPQRSRR